MRFITISAIRRCLPENKIFEIGVNNVFRDKAGLRCSEVGGNRYQISYLESTFDVTDSSGVAAFHAPVEGTIPVSALVDGENSIAVKFPDDISQGWPKIVTEKIIVGWQN